MIVTKTLDYQESGRRIEGDNSIVVRPVSQINVKLSLQETKKILNDLDNLVGVNGPTEKLIAMLKGATE